MNRIALSPTAPSSDTWPSATASISALAPRWPGSKRASRSRNWYGGSRCTKSTWRGWSDSTRRTSVGSRRSRSPGDRGRPAADAGSGSGTCHNAFPITPPLPRPPPCALRSGVPHVSVGRVPLVTDGCDCSNHSPRTVAASAPNGGLRQSCQRFSAGAAGATSRRAGRHCRRP